MHTMLLRLATVIATISVVLSAAPADAEGPEVTPDPFGLSDGIAESTSTEASDQPPPAAVAVDLDALAALSETVFGDMPNATSVDGDLGAAAVTTHVVTTELDIVSGADSVLSLREAITMANTDGTDSVIKLLTGVSHDLTNCGPVATEEDSNVDGDLDHFEDNRLTLDGGPGIDLYNGMGFAVIRNTCPQERVLDSSSTQSVMLQGVLMSDGDTDGGAAVLSLGSVEVKRSAFSGNTASSLGGAIVATGDVTATQSIFIDNDSLVAAGAIYSMGAVDLTNVSIAGSDAAVAGAVVAIGDLTTRFSSIAFNTTTTLGSADVITTGNLTSEASLFGENQGPSLLCSVTGTSTSNGYNFATDFSCGLTGTTDTESLTTDPGVIPSLILAPRPDSPLHNVIPPAACLSGLDALGTARPQGERCEIGAVEVPVSLVDAILASTDVLTPVVIADVLVESNFDNPFDFEDPTSLRLRTAPSKGSAVLDGKQLTYTPDGSGDGLDSFALEMCDTVGLDCAEIVVNVTIDGLRSKWFFTNVLQGGAATAELLFGKGAGDEFFIGDFDGDGVDDIAKRAVGTNVFEIRSLTGVAPAANQILGYGKPGDEVFVGDWNANGSDTFAVRRGNQFLVKNSVSPGPADVVIGYGKVGDEVLVGDWDANGSDTFAVRRMNVFFARNSITTGPADEVFGYGKAADSVLVGDWDANGSDTFAVQRGNTIFVRNDFATAPAEFSFAFGKASDELFPGDWNNDTLDTFAVRRIVN